MAEGLEVVTWQVKEAMPEDPGPGSVPVKLERRVILKLEGR